MEKGFTVYGEIKGKDEFSPAAESAKKSTDELGSSGEKSSNVFEQMTGKISANKAMLLGWMGGMTAAAAVAIKLTSELYEFVDAVATEEDALAKLARRTNLAVEELSALDYAAEKGGVSTETLAKSLQTLSKNANDMTRGVGEGKVAFEELGISVTDSDGKLKSSMTLMYEVADALAGLDDENKKTALSMKLLGESGAGLLNVFDGGAEAMREAMTEAQRYGAVLSGEAAAGAEEFKDSQLRLSTALKGIKRDIAEEIMPAMTGFLNKTAELLAFARTGEIVLPRPYEAQITAMRGLKKELDELNVAYTLVNEETVKIPVFTEQGLVWIEQSVDSFKESVSTVKSEIKISDEIKNEMEKWRSAALPPMQRLNEEMAVEIQVWRDRLAQGVIPPDAADAAIANIRAFYGAQVDAMREGEEEKAEVFDSARAQYLMAEDDKAEALVEQIRQSNMTEIELLEEKIETERSLLESHGMTTVQTEAYYNNQVIALDKKMAAQEKQIAATRHQAWMADAEAYKSAASSLGQMMGLSVKNQAMVMIPFEIAEGTKEMARFLATKDPTHLASSLQHALAVVQYAQAANASAPSSPSSSSSGSGSPDKSSPSSTRSEEEKIEEERMRRGSVTVYLDEGAWYDPREVSRIVGDAVNYATGDRVKINVVGK